MKPIVAWLAVAATGCTFARGVREPVDADPGDGSGDGTPGLVGRRIQGSLPYLGSYEMVDLARWRGRVVALVVFSADMHNARDAVAFFANLQDHYRNRGAEIVAVSVDEDYRAAEALKRELAAGFTILRDPGGEMTRRIGVTGLPTTLVVDADGRVSGAYTGYDEDSAAGIVASIETARQVLARANRGGRVPRMAQRAVASAEPDRPVVRQSTRKVRPATFKAPKRARGRWVAKRGLRR